MQYADEIVEPDFDRDWKCDALEGVFQVPVPVKPVYGTRSGPLLDPEAIRAGRQKEMDSIARHDVVELVRTAEAVGGSRMKGGWVEDWKGDVVRSRFVVKQVAYQYRDDVTVHAGDSHFQVVAEFCGILLSVVRG